jgi:hypothetical protein
MRRDKEGRRMADRVEEYIRRMKARGYEPTLMGMDDDDIEYELRKMDEAERRREAEQQPVRTVYRPVDPGLKARILRMFGQPYDKSAIPKGQEFYLNGWDNGDDDDLFTGKNSWVEAAPPRNGAGGTVLDDPGAKAWKLAKTMEAKWTIFRPEDYSNEIQLASAEPPVRAFDSIGEGGKVTLANPKIGRELVKEGTEGVKEVIKLHKFGEKAYKVAKDQNYSHEEATEIAKEAQAMYTAYKFADWGVNTLLLKKRNTWPAYGAKEGAEEVYDDEIHNYIIQTAISNYKLGKNPPEGSILPP